MTTEIRARARVLPVGAPLHGVGAPHPETYIGIDQSLTGTGVGMLLNGRMQTMLVAPKKLVGVPRLSWFHAEFTFLLTRHKPTAVAIEGYSFSSKSRGHSLGELGGVLRLAAWQCHIPTIYVVAPNSLKLFCTGNGIADKSLISKELYRRYGVDAPNNNEADGAGLALFALAMQHLMELTKDQRRALNPDKIEVIQHPLQPI